MNVTLFINQSPVNALNKQLTELVSYECRLKDSTSIINPTILLQSELSNLVTANYCYIPTFHRYYFINDITSVNNSIFEISCHVDVLKSFAAVIYTSQAIIKRQENQYNLLINDGSVRTYADSWTFTKTFPAGFSNPSIILNVAGSNV